MSIERRIIKATWGYNGDLEPLSELEDLGDSIQVTFDLPRVKKEDVEINLTEDCMELKAKLCESVCWEKWGSIQKRLTFQTFQKQIKLPVHINQKEASASFKNGVLRVVIPKLREKVLIHID